MRRLLRLALRAVGLILAAPALFFLAGFAGALLPGSGDWDADPAEIRIGLIRGPIHYDFLLPLDDPLRARFGFATAAGAPPLTDPRAAWLVVGWGSEAFYTTAGSYAQITASAVWQAATGDAAVLRLDVLPAVPADFAPVSWLDLSQPQYDALLRGIAADFAASGPTPHPARGLTSSDSFWRAPGRFHLFRPCNQWVGERLRAAGVPFGPWTPTPQSVALSLWWNARP